MGERPTVVARELLSQHRTVAGARAEPLTERGATMAASAGRSLGVLDLLERDAPFSGRIARRKSQARESLD